MSHHLSGKRIAFLATHGVEQIELRRPLDAVREAGAEAELVSPEEGEIQGYQKLEKGDTFAVDTTVSEASAGDYDGLVLPGGVANPDFLRMDPEAVGFVRAFIEAGKPVGAICHAPWMLVEADVVRGKRLTSYWSLRTDIRTAGGYWIDEPVVVDRGLTTSRNPDDLEAFCAKLVEELHEGRHEDLAAQTAAADQAADAGGFEASDAR
jgi:protease I